MYYGAVNGQGSLPTQAVWNIVMSNEMAEKFKWGEWLNDDCINYYFGLLQQRDARMRQHVRHTHSAWVPRVHFFSTHFYTKLSENWKGYSYGAVARWTRAKQMESLAQTGKHIMDCDFLIFPVHIPPNHWICVVVDLRPTPPIILYYDPLGVRN